MHLHFGQQNLCYVVSNVHKGIRLDCAVYPAESDAFLRVHTTHNEVVQDGKLSTGITAQEHSQND